MVYKVNQPIIMLLRFLTIDSEVKVKAQIQKKGRLGFSSQAISKFNLDASKGLIFAVDEVEPQQGVFYGLVAPANAPGAIKFVKSGAGYFAVESPSTFNKLGFDYKNESCIFSIEEVLYNGASVLKFTRREPRGNRPKE
jgi:hypothetical protein